MSNLGSSSENPIPVVILVSKSGKPNRATPKRKASSAGQQLPWMWIAVGGCAAWVLIVLAIVVTNMTREPEQNAAAVARLGAVEPAFKVRPVVPQEVVEEDVVEPKRPVREVVDEAPAFDDAPPKAPIGAKKVADKRLFASCEQIGTKVLFMRNPPDAFNRAKAEKKMVFIVHLSGNLEDKEFTWNNADAFRVNALADQRVGDYINENYISTFLKVGTFRIINGQKTGGNVASYFCLADGSVIHAVPGQVNANKLMNEARWAYETRKSALTVGTDLETGNVSMRKYEAQVRKAHTERFFAERGNAGILTKQGTLPINMPTGTPQVQAHWLLARSPLIRLDDVYPTVWTQILNEQLSTLPVEQR